MRGQVTRSTGSWYTVRMENGQMHEARLRGKFKLLDKKITNPVAVGDNVEVKWIGDDPIITKIHDRDNYVIRVSPKKKGHSHLLAANIDQAILVASLKQPKTSLGFIDRFFVSLETFRIPGKLIINKSDLFDDDDWELAGAIASIYSTIGYETTIVSLMSEDLDQNQFEDKLTLLSGHSGIGKSTLINHLLPDANQDVNEISKFADKGIHTTTFAEMFEINPGAFIIDTPGIKELGLAEIEKEELSHYFPEMRELLGSCRFNNCIHVNEPGCAVLHALQEGLITSIRYRSYLSMLEDEDNRR